MLPGPSVCDDRLTFPQGWRGSVKTRHFVMALRDYYQEKWAHTGQESDKAKAADDAWASPTSTSSGSNPSVRRSMMTLLAL
jgi:hypothetical protein